MTATTIGRCGSAAPAACSSADHVVPSNGLTAATFGFEPGPWIVQQRYPIQP